MIPEIITLDGDGCGSNGNERYQRRMLSFGGFAWSFNGFGSAGHRMKGNGAGRGDWPSLRWRGRGMPDSSWWKQEV